MTKVPYVHSGYDRIKDDDYKTVDKRCIYGFLEHFKPEGLCVDVCAPSGSGIVDTLLEKGYEAVGLDDAFRDGFEADWIITNPPYKRPMVDEIIYRQIARIGKGEVKAVACLLRSNFSYAKSRQTMFRYNRYYYGGIKLLFRAWWVEEEKRDSRRNGPIHNFTWHIWKPTWNLIPAELFSEGKEYD